MSITRTLLGRGVRDQVSGRKPARRLAIKSLRSQFGLNEFYLATFTLLIFALCYKFAIIWTIAFMVLAAGCWSGRQHLTKINFALVIALIYVGDATITAFLVSFQAGVYRSAQFILIAASLIGVFAQSFKMRSPDALRVLKVVGLASCIIFAHLIIYHIMAGRYITWKYLSDTKTIISLTVFLCFALRDQIARRVPFLLVLTILAALIIMSAERKALLLMAVLLLSSNMSVSTKTVILVAAPITLVLVAVFGIDGGYLYNKFQASSASYAELSDRYFTTVHNIGDFSNVIREFTNRKAWQLFEQNPWFGIGATGYWEWATAAYGRGSGMAMNVHGEVNRVPAEGGIVGIIIAIMYISVIGWRTGHFAFLRSGRTASSLERTPLYLLLYVMCYAYAEAIDSAMLVLIGLAGVVSARLPSPTFDVLIRRKPPASRKLSLPAIVQRPQPTLVRRLAGR